MVIAPSPDAFGELTGAADDVARLRADARVVLLVPDESTVAAIGPNLYDPERRGAAAACGRAQATAVVAELRELWPPSQDDSAPDPLSRRTTTD